MGLLIELGDGETKHQAFMLSYLESATQYQFVYSIDSVPAVSFLLDLHKEIHSLFVHGVNVGKYAYKPKLSNQQ